MKLIAVALLLWAPLVSASQASDLIVLSEPLRAEVQLDPWNVRFVDRLAGTLLVESSTTPAGFRTAAGWLRATRAIESHKEGDVVFAVLETDDPDGRTLEATISPDRAGVISVELRLRHGIDTNVQAPGIGFDTEPT